jgi:hypothetical protein
MSDLDVTIPIRTSAWTNTRGHWRANHERKTREKTVTAWALRGAGRLPPLPAHVVITRLAPRLLDDDNLPSATKYMRDEIARAYDVDDSPRSPLTWEYRQERSKTYAVRIQINQR